MAFTLFDFTKSWRNFGDFPTFEPDETKVRDDMQSLFDELKTGLNNLIGEIKAKNIPFTPTAEVDSTDVQNAIENVQSQIASAILGELPDGSVTSAKLAGSAVTSAKIADGAVTAGKIASGVVPVPTTITPKMDGEASQGTRTGFSRGDHVHPKDTSKADLSGGKVLPDQLSRSRVNVTASRALALTDDGKALYVSSSSAVTVTVPANSSVQLPVGSEIFLYRDGSGTVTVAAASGVTLRCSDPSDSLKRYDTARLKKWEANVWSLELNHSGVSDEDVTAAKIASGAVTAEKLADGAVTNDKLAPLSVGTSKLIDGSVSRDKIYTNAVSEELTITLSSSDVWTQISGYDTYQHDHAVSAALAGDKAFINIRRGAGGNYNLNKSYFESDLTKFEKIYNYSIPEDGVVRFIAPEPITGTLYLNLLLIHK